MGSNKKNLEDVCYELMKENSTLKFKLTTMQYRMKLLEYIVEYMHQFVNWFHMFIALFNSNTLPESFFIFNSVIYGFPAHILTLSREFQKALQTVNSHSIIDDDEHDRIFIQYEQKLDEYVKRFGETNLSNLKKMKKEFASNGISETKRNQIKKILKIGDDDSTTTTTTTTTTDDEDNLIFMLKQKEILWNMIGSIFGKTPFLSDASSVSSVFVNLQNFQKYFQTYFSQHVNFVVRQAKFTIQTMPAQIQLPQNTVYLPDEIIDSVVKCEKNILASKNYEQYVRRKILAQSNVEMFLDKIYQKNETTLKKMFTTVTNRSVGPPIFSFLTSIVASFDSNIIFNFYSNIFQENAILKEFIKTLSVCVNFQSEFLNTRTLLGYDPLCELINKFEKKL